MKILFVCLGNICRSPTAEAVFRDTLQKAQIPATLDSAGTADYHVGERSDRRSIAHAEKRGYAMIHRARQVSPHDFGRFDLIFAMDRANLSNLRKLAPNAESAKKLHLITAILQDPTAPEVPDPYTGGPEDFEHVLDLLERCAAAWLPKLRSRHSPP